MAGKRYMLSRATVIGMAAGLLCFLGTASAGVNSNIVMKYPNGEIKPLPGKFLNAPPSIYPFPKMISVSNYDGEIYKEFNENNNLGNSYIFGRDSLFGGVTYTAEDIARIVLCNGKCELINKKTGKPLKELPLELRLDLGGYLSSSDPKKANINVYVPSKVFRNYENNRDLNGDGSGTTASSNNNSGSSSGGGYNDGGIQ